MALADGRQVTTWTLVRGIYKGTFDTDHAAEVGTEQPAAGLRWCWEAGVVMVDHHEHLPEIITREAVPFVPSLPDDQEIFSIVRATVALLKKDKPIAVDLSQDHIRPAVRALRGLTRTQIRRLVADAMADDRFDATDVRRLGEARARFVGRGARRVAGERPGRPGRGRRCRTAQTMAGGAAHGVRCARVGGSRRPAWRSQDRLPWER